MASDYHCIVTRTINRSRVAYSVGDCDSTNGTRVNDRRLTRGEQHLLVDGDVIRIGNTDLVWDQRQGPVRADENRGTIRGDGEQFNLRPYQCNAIERALASLGSKRNPRTLISLPTGSGKTAVGLVTAGRYARGKIVQWLAYQQELCDRAEEELATLRRAGIVGEETTFHFETIQTNANWELLPRTGLIVADEAHHLHGDTVYWGDLLDRRRPILGLTGTPRRSHDDDGWDLASYVSRSELTPRYLAVPVPFGIRTDFSPHHVGVSPRFYGRDFDEETYRALDVPRRNQWIAQQLARHQRRLGRMLVFVHTQQHCQTLAAACSDAGLRAAYVHQGSRDRSYVFDDFRRGVIQVLVNAKLVTEGVDVPDLDTVVMAVPTMSDIRFAQMLGRGCRKTASKAHFNVVDFVDNLGEFEPLLAGRYLFDGARDRRAEFEPNAAEKLTAYKFLAREQLDQPYLDDLRQQLRHGFLDHILASALRPEDVEAWLLTFAKKHHIALSLDESRPLEVPLVHQYIFPLLSSCREGVGARLEMACAEGTRCDIFVHGDPADVIEFSTEHVRQSKAEQLLGYVERFSRDGVARKFRATLVAVSYDGDSLSRPLRVAGHDVDFVNWHDYIQGLLAAPK